MVPIPKTHNMKEKAILQRNVMSSVLVVMSELSVVCRGKCLVDNWIYWSEAQITENFWDRDKDL